VVTDLGFTGNGKTTLSKGGSHLFPCKSTSDGAFFANREVIYFLGDIF
jgi:hypothetical protein